MSVLHNLDLNVERAGAPSRSEGPTVQPAYDLTACAVSSSRAYKRADPQKDAYHEDIIFKETKEEQMML